MPRGARQVSRSGVYHIMFRGNERRDIFVNDEDRVRFIQLLAEKSMEEGFSVYAYCLMDNHVHILLSGTHEGLSRLVKRINTSYVYYFNKKYDRVGHLFHDRYKSEAVENDTYLLEAVRYIHNNPIKAGMVGEASDYKWSSYRLYLAPEGQGQAFIDTEYVLGLFSENLQKARKQFIDFTSQKSDLEFIDITKENEKESPTITGEMQAREYIEKVLKKKGLEPGCLRQKGYEDIRNKLILDLRKNSNLSVRQIALVLGINRGMVQRVKV